MGHRLDPTPRSGRRWLTSLALFGLLGVPVGGGAASGPGPALRRLRPPSPAPSPLRALVVERLAGRRGRDPPPARRDEGRRHRRRSRSTRSRCADDVPKDGLAAFPERPWLSPQWCAAVKAAAEGARARGMTADIIVGSGWPFGGRFLEPSEQTKRVRLVKKELRGPDRRSRPRSPSSPPPGRRSARRSRVPPRLAFVRLVRGGRGRDFDPGQELAPGALRDGRVRVSVPAGPHVLRVGLLETGFTNVKLGAPGADGPVVDHWSAAGGPPLPRPHVGGPRPRPRRAARREAGRPAARELRGQPRARPRELDGRPARRVRAAARLRPRAVPAVRPRPRRARATTRPAPTPCAGPATTSTARVVELFQERFLATYVGWAHENGLLARMQAYGRETHVLEGSLQVDLPEGESWLWSGHDRIVVSPTVANKYVSSAAHLAGRGPVSFEAMTNAVPVFREMPEDFKLGMDQSALAGVHQPVLHGFSYSPREAGFPGWVRFGSWFNEQNPWWPHVRRFTDYAARLTTVLSSSEFQASVALLGPRADEWARDGLLYQPFPEVSRPWYHYHLWQALQQAGYGTDFVSEGVLRGAQRRGRHDLRYGARSLRHARAHGRRLARAGDRGGDRALRRGGRARRLRRPHARRARPGLKDAAEADRRVQRRGRAAARRGRGRAASSRAVAAAPLPPRRRHARRRCPTAPAARCCSGSLAHAAARSALEPDVRVGAPAPGRRPRPPPRGRARDLLPREREPDARLGPRGALPHRRPPAVALGPGDGHARADAALGAARHAGAPPRAARVAAPGVRAAVTAEAAVRRRRSRRTRPKADELRAATGRRPRAVRPGRDGLPVVAPWDVALRPAGGSAFHRRIPQLFDLSLAAGDPEVAGFGGVALYRAEFDWTDETRTRPRPRHGARRLLRAAQRPGPRRALVGPAPLRRDGRAAEGPQRARGRGHDDARQPHALAEGQPRGEALGVVVPAHPHGPRRARAAHEARG